jgi:hypothetical protein
LIADMNVRGPVAPGVAGFSGLGPSSKTMLSIESASSSATDDSWVAGLVWAGFVLLGESLAPATAEEGRCAGAGKKGLGDEKALVDGPAADGLCKTHSSHDYGIGTHQVHI